MYRILEVGEIIRSGDEELWHDVLGDDNEGEETWGWRKVPIDYVGKPADGPPEYSPLRRPMSVSDEAIRNSEW